MIRIFIIAVFLLALGLTKAQAQDVKPYLVIKVLNEFGEPLSYARVTVSQNRQMVADESTDSSGTIIMAALNLGSHVVVIYDGSKTQKVDVYMKKGHNELFLEMGREQLSPIAIEAEPVLIDDSYSGSVSIGDDAVNSWKGCPGYKHTQWEFSANIVGGIWLSDTRAPTFQNMMNMQPND